MDVFGREDVETALKAAEPLLAWVAASLEA
jgi:hypothetical protein